MADLAAWADVKSPKFFTASHVDISKIEHVSKFRSRAGHDYSDSFETCCSMKHYFQHYDFYNAALDNPIYAGHDGTVLYVWKQQGQYSHEWREQYEKNTGKEWPEDRWDYQIYVRPDAAPNMWIHYHHIMPIDDILDTIDTVSDRDLFRGSARPAIPGHRIRAGDLLGHGLGEISVEQHLTGNGVPSPCVTGFTHDKMPNVPACKAIRKYHSIFWYMTDEVFAEYQEIGNVTRDDFNISAEELARRPYTCDGDKFVNRGSTDDPEVYLRLQPPAEQSAPDLQASANNREILASLESSGSDVLGPIEYKTNYSIILWSQAGPIQLLLDDGTGQRTIYTGLENNTPINHTIEGLTPGNITILVQANPDVEWQIVIVKGVF